MNATLAFATTAHFALAAASNDPGSLATVYGSLQEIATRLNLPEEESKAAKALHHLKEADAAQLTFDSLIRSRLGKEDAS